MNQLNNDILRVVLTHSDCDAIAALIGEQITEEYTGRNPLIVCVLKGAAPFATRLFCAIACPAEIEFVQASSYGSSDKSGDFTLKKDTDCNVSGRDVIIVDDILDTGKTLLNIREMMVARGAASVKLCVLFNKPSRREAPIEADFVGLTVPDEFLVGFGLDFAERYRNLPYVGVLKPSIYAGNQI